MRNSPLATAAQTTNSVGENGAGRYRIQAIERAVSILNAFTPDEPEMGVSDLAQRLSLHKSTVHRFVVNLEAAGLLERNRTTSRYRLGLRIFELGSQVLAQMNLWEEAPPFLEGLVRDTGETGHLAIFDGGEAIYIEKVEARRALRSPRPSAVAIRRMRPASAKRSLPTKARTSSKRSSPSVGSRAVPHARSVSVSSCLTSSSGCVRWAMRLTTRSMRRGFAALAPPSSGTPEPSSPQSASVDR